jgi:2-polyprenyl-3-methyl-5-hydroxy-6-metoxy-1,4-benzoquinol methylase
VKVCPLCGVPAILQFHLEHTQVWNCTDDKCGLQFADPQLDEGNLVRAYHQFYYPAGNNGSKVRFEETPGVVLHQMLYQLAGRLGSLEGLRILDYGCGRGALSRVAREHGLLPVGIEPDENARKAAREINSVRAYGSLREMQLDEPGTAFDLIVLWNVIEHLRQPWVDLCRLRALLRPEAWLVLSTMNICCLRARFERKRWENYGNPTHFYYFERNSLEHVIRAAGFNRVTECKLNVRYPHHGHLRRLANRVSTALGISDGLVYLCSVASHSENEFFEPAAVRQESAK